MEVDSVPFGSAHGQECMLWTVKNGKGLEVAFTNFGGTLVSVKTPSATSAKPQEVTLNHRTLAELSTKNDPYMGVTVGRFANRIAKGAFTLDGKAYSLATNNGPNALHGGKQGFDKRVWTPLSTRVTKDEAVVTLGLTSAHGEEGFPGTLVARVEFAVNSANELRMTFSATTDAPTIVNMCNHAYWNLSGGLSTDVTGHVLTLHAPYYLPVDATSIPTGEVRAVAGGQFDFTQPRRVGDVLKEVDGGGQPGYDHCWVRGPAGSVKAGFGELPLSPIAHLADPSSGRSMTVSTDAPGVQHYTGNWLGPGPAPHKQWWALCLETQNFPDAPNKEAAGFPSPVLRPGQTYSHTAVHAFAWTA
jgi:aldose 1-epimerase